MPPPAQNAREGKEDNRDIPPAFTEDLTLREMKASFKSNKGALTRLSNQVKVRAETFIDINSPGSATQLNESYNKFLAKCDFLHRAAHQLALEDEENRQIARTKTQRWHRRPRPSQYPGGSATPRPFTDVDYHSPACAPSGWTAHPTPAAP